MDLQKTTPSLSLIPPGVYTIERMKPDNNRPAVYPVSYITNEGYPGTYYAFCLKENDELIPVSAFVTRAIIVDGRTVISPGFYDSYDSLLKCVEIVAASSGKFMLSHVKGIWADKGRRKGTKPIVKPIP